MGASINRATSNITEISLVYTSMFKATLTHKVDGMGVTRRCFTMMEGYDFWNQVCFTSRQADPRKDRMFSVADFERMLWAEHAGTVGDDPTSQVDTYTDNHNGLVMHPDGLSTLLDRFERNPPFPITNSTRLAYLCKQSYIIDPTGWSIGPISMTQITWPNCDDRVVIA